MRQFSKPHNYKEWFYIKYSYADPLVAGTEICEFWTDNEEEFLEKYKFISRHARYKLINYETPLTEAT